MNDNNNMATTRREGIRATLRRLLRTLRPARSGALPAPQVQPLAIEPLPPVHPRERLRELLAQSEAQGRDEAELAWFSAVLQSLLPDQARILAALSDGSGYPLIHIHAGARLGLSTHPVLECVSVVGRSAGVMCPEFTHVYVQALRQLGLVEIDDIESEQTMKYELLETEIVVRNMLDRLKQSKQRSRIVRGTLRMSDLGRRLWQVCGPDTE